jgi:hypothetical protein
MRTPAFLSLFLVSAALVAQAPASAPAQAPIQAPAQSLGDQVKAERPAIEQLMAELKYPEAMKRAEALIPAVKPTFNKTDNTTLVQSCSLFLDLATAYRLAAETADSAGAWEKALDYAKAGRDAAMESYAGVKEPFTKNAADYALVSARAKQVLLENDDRIKELKAKKVLDAGERQELDLALGVEREVGDSLKWSKFFQAYVDVAKRESGAYDPLVKVMEDKLQGEANQVADYKAGKGDRLKWVDAVISTPAYLEAQGDRAGKARWLYRLATLAPENKKVQHQLDVLNGKAAAPPAKAGKKGK